MGRRVLSEAMSKSSRELKTLVKALELDLSDKVMSKIQHKPYKNRREKLMAEFTRRKVVLLCHMEQDTCESINAIHNARDNILAAQVHVFISIALMELSNLVLKNRPSIMPIHRGNQTIIESNEESFDEEDSDRKDRELDQTTDTSHPTVNLGHEVPNEGKQRVIENHNFSLCHKKNAIWDEGEKKYPDTESETAHETDSETNISYATSFDSHDSERTRIISNFDDTGDYNSMSNPNIFRLGIKVSSLDEHTRLKRIMVQRFMQEIELKRVLKTSPNFRALVSGYDECSEYSSRCSKMQGCRCPQHKNQEEAVLEALLGSFIDCCVHIENV